MDKSLVNQEVSAQTLMFGNGRYSFAMKELFHDLERFFPEYSADKRYSIAKRFGTDLGSAFAKVEVRIKFGKEGKDGTITLSESLSKAKGIVMTYPISIARAVDYANQASKFGIELVKIDFDTNIAEWIAGMNVETIPAAAVELMRKDKAKAMA